MSDDFVVDLIPDDLSLARAQLTAGLLGQAEGSLRRHIARLDADDGRGLDELDAARALLAETLWRQGRPMAGAAAIDSIRAGSLERRRPIVLLVEAEAMAAAGDPDRANALMERVIESVGVDEAWRLRGGISSRLPWPVPASMRPTPRRPSAPAFGGSAPPAGTTPPSPERTAAAHARLEAARLAYNGGRDDEGDRELGLALRLDPRVAAEGVALAEPTLGPQPQPDRLLLYGDLLRAAGRTQEASEAYDRAARAGA